MNFNSCHWFTILHANCCLRYDFVRTKWRSLPSRVSVLCVCIVLAAPEIPWQPNPLLSNGCVFIDSITLGNVFRQLLPSNCVIMAFSCHVTIICCHRKSCVVHSVHMVSPLPSVCFCVPHNVDITKVNCYDIIQIMVTIEKTADGVRYTIVVQPSKLPCPFFVKWMFWILHSYV
jgi:hypothetical protein